MLQLCVRRVIAKMLRVKLARYKKRILNAIDQRRSQELKSALEESRAIGALRLFVYRKGEEVLKVVLREERVVATLERLKDEDVEGPHFEVSSCFGFLFIFYFFLIFLVFSLPRPPFLTLFLSYFFLYPCLSGSALNPIDIPSKAPIFNNSYASLPF